MNEMEFNKIFAAILVAGIIAGLAGFVSNKLVHPHYLEEDAVPIEGVEVVAGAAAVEKKAEPILALIAEASVERGKALSKACSACHSFDKGGPHGIGPNLWGVLGADKAAKEGYSYSSALEEFGGQWTYLALNKFFWKPKEYVPGTKMNYLGLKKPSDRAALVAWLRTLDDTQASLPTQAEIDAELLELAPPVEEADEDTQEETTETEGEVAETEDENASESDSDAGNVESIEPEAGNPKADQAVPGIESPALKDDLHVHDL